MYQIRVLTGHHAGVQVPLEGEECRIGRGSDADITLEDWQGQDIVVRVLDLTESPVSWRAESEADFRPWPAFKAARFGDMVLCVGPLEGSWPSDISLLQSVVASERPRRPKGQRWPMWWTALAVTVGACLLYGYTSVVASETSSKAVTEEPLNSRVYRAIQDARIEGVIAKATGDRVVVEGLLDSADKFVLLRSILARFPPDLVEQNFASASTLAQTITEALADPGVKASYVSHGRFLVEGATVHVDQVRERAERVQADLAPLVTGISLAVKRLPPPPRQGVGAMLSGDGVEYVQTKDGVKHLSVLPWAIHQLED